MNTVHILCHRYMLDYSSKPSRIKFSSKSIFGGANLILNGAPIFGPNPGGNYGDQGG